MGATSACKVGSAPLPPESLKSATGLRSSSSASVSSGGLGVLSRAPAAADLALPLSEGGPESDGEPSPRAADFLLPPSRGDCDGDCGWLDELSRGARWLRRLCAGVAGDDRRGSRGVAPDRRTAPGVPAPDHRVMAGELLTSCSTLWYFFSSSTSETSRDVSLSPTACRQCGEAACSQHSSGTQPW